MDENDKVCEVVIEELGADKEEIYEKSWELEGNIEDICLDVGTKELETVSCISEEKVESVWRDFDKEVLLVVGEISEECIWSSEGRELEAKEVLEDKCDWLLEEEDPRVDEVIEEHVEHWIKSELVTGNVAWRLVCISVGEDVVADEESGELIADNVPPTDGIREGCVKLLEAVDLDDEHVEHFVAEDLLVDEVLWEYVWLSEFVGAAADEDPGEHVRHPIGADLVVEEVLWECVWLLEEVDLVIDSVNGEHVEHSE
jgi:hypothetical protein